tara:strand:+ start:283 stop:546 length:264 start_codon:yes stop_codon:yes gene_type:complete
MNDFVEKVIDKTKNPLKLYLVQLPGNISLGYDSCGEFITVNYTEDEARNTTPKYDWVSDISSLIVTEIGFASENMKVGIILQHNYYG